MRIVSIILYLLAGIGFGLWLLFYGYVVAMACAFSGPNTTSCTTPMPWELNGDDFMLLVVIPASIVAGLLVLAFVARRAARRQSA